MLLFKAAAGGTERKGEMETDLSIHGYTYYIVHCALRLIPMVAGMNMVRVVKAHVLNQRFSFSFNEKHDSSLHSFFNKKIKKSKGRKNYLDTFGKGYSAINYIFMEN